MNIKTEISLIVKSLGFSKLNDLQYSMLDCQDKNIILLSPTGSGKSVAFLLPTILSEQRTLIITPSRELSLQIDSVIRATKSGTSSICCYGGHSLRSEERSLEYDPKIIVGTAGRLLDHLRRGNIDPATIDRLVFDEYDKLLDLGFEEEIKEIVSFLKNIKNRILTSATTTEEIPEYLGMTNPKTIDFLKDAKEIDISIKKVIVKENGRQQQLLELLCNLPSEPTIIFCTFREAAEEVNDFLNNSGVYSVVFHGGMEQFDREQALSKFRNGSYNILVSTDLASRGIDIPDISHIIHYQLQRDESSFTHRNGRTARMNKSGKVFVLTHPDDKLPEYMDNIQSCFDVTPSKPIPEEPYFETFFINRGKKDKINKIDIVGVLCKIGELEKSEIGLIEVKDRCSYVAVPRDLAHEVARRVRGIKIKRISTLISIAR